jgi:hypothetical protein
MLKGLKVVLHLKQKALHRASGEQVMRPQQKSSITAALYPANAFAFGLVAGALPLITCLFLGLRGIL